MEGITGIVNTALLIIGSIAAVVATGAGLYFWYTATGQEEGE